MPTTFIGLGLFVLFLTPGLCFFLVRATRRPQRDLTVLQETGAVLLVSVVVGLALLGLFGVIRLAAPGLTPDVGALIRAPGDYWRAEYLKVSIWTVVLVIAACIAAAVGGYHEYRLSAFLRGRLGRYFAESAWYLMLEEPENEILVECKLDDGSVLSGWFVTGSAQFEETGDRDLVLASPIRIQEDHDQRVIADVGSVILSARRIVNMRLYYYPTGSADMDRRSEGIAGPLVSIPALQQSDEDDPAEQPEDERPAGQGQRSAEIP